MRAFVVTAPGEYDLTDAAEPAPGPGEVLIAPEAVGICGSDLELLYGHRPPGYARAGGVPDARRGVATCAPGRARRPGSPTPVFDPGPLVTHTYPLEEVATALAVLADRGSGALKVLIVP